MMRARSRWSDPTARGRLALRARGALAGSLAAVLVGAPACGGGVEAAEGSASEAGPATAGAIDGVDGADRVEVERVDAASPVALVWARDGEGNAATYRLDAQGAELGRSEGILIAIGGELRRWVTERVAVA